MSTLPCFERQHHYKEIMGHVAEIKKLTGPIYDITRGHAYNEVMTKVDR